MQKIQTAKKQDIGHFGCLRRPFDLEAPDHFQVSDHIW
jgi:hypothetical protein